MHNRPYVEADGRSFDAKYHVECEKAALCSAVLYQGIC